MARPQFFDVPEAGGGFGAELWPRRRFSLSDRKMILIALLSGRNLPIRDFGWEEVCGGVGKLWQLCAASLDPNRSPQELTRGGEKFAQPPLPLFLLGSLAPILGVPACRLWR